MPKYDVSIVTHFTVETDNLDLALEDYETAIINETATTKVTFDGSLVEYEEVY